LTEYNPLIIIVTKSTDEFTLVNVFRLSNLALGVFVNLIIKKVKTRQKPKEGIYKKRSAIVAPIEMKTFETTDKVIR